MTSDDLITLCLAWLFIGTLFWALVDPREQADFVLRQYVHRYHRLPSRGFVVVQAVVAILWWPKIARALWEQT